jgi:hypothetical protein
MHNRAHFHTISSFFKPSIFLSFSIIVFSAGCVAVPICEKSETTYIRVDYSAKRTLHASGTGEIHGTDAYKRDRPSYKRLAIRAPESCMDQSHGQISGVRNGRSGGTILQTRCGVWFSELEKALVKEGFEVISWDLLIQGGSGRSGDGGANGNREIYKRANELGADVVFMVNSLEITEAGIGENADSEYRFFNSDPTGAQRGPASLITKLQKQLVKFIKERTSSNTREATGQVDLMSILDVTAIVPATGQTVWFYSRRHIEERSESNGSQQKNFLFALQNENSLWWPVFPVGQEQDQVRSDRLIEKKSSSVFREHSEASAGKGDLYQARQLKLIRAVVTDVVTEFKHGK